jgi:hypothetical protein
MKCETMSCDHKVIVLCEVLKNSLIIEAYDEAYDYYFTAYIDNEKCDEGRSKLIYELAEKGDYEKILTLICDD